MIYFTFVIYGKETPANFATSYHRWGWIIVGFDRFFVHALSRSRIKRHSDSQSNAHNNCFCRFHFTGWINRRDHADGSHHCIDRRLARIIQALNLEKIDPLTSSSNRRCSSFPILCHFNSFGQRGMRIEQEHYPFLRINFSQVLIRQAHHGRGK